MGTSGHRVCEGAFELLPDDCLNELIDKLTLKDILALRLTSQSLGESLRKPLLKRAKDRAPAVILASYLEPVSKEASDSPQLKKAENELIAAYLTIFQRFLGRSGLKPYLKIFKGVCGSSTEAGSCRHLIHIEKWGLLSAGTGDFLSLLVFGSQAGEERLFRISLNSLKEFGGHFISVERIASVGGQDFIILLSGLSRTREKPGDLIKALVKVRVDPKQGIFFPQVKIIPGPHEYHPLYQTVIVKGGKLVIHQGKRMIIGNVSDLEIAHMVTESKLIKQVALDPEDSSSVLLDTGTERSLGGIKRLKIESPYSLSGPLEKSSEGVFAKEKKGNQGCTGLGTDWEVEGHDRLTLGVRQSSLFSKMVGLNRTSGIQHSLGKVGEYGDLFTHLGEATAGIWYLANVRGDLIYVNGWLDSSPL